MNIPALVANSAWWLDSFPEARRFRHAMSDVEGTQRAVLARILRANIGTQYGREHGFETIRTVEEYQQRVPLVTYEDLHPWIEASAQGQAHQLFPGLPRCFQPTSGSTSASKLIPYTAALQAEFQAGIAPWMADMFRHYPGMRTGGSYWSISPATYQQCQTASGIPIGFDDDTAYLHPLIAGLLGKVLAVPPAVARITDMRAFRYVTLAFLLRARDLRFISIWNPTFLTLLLDPLALWSPSLIDDLAKGTLTPPGGLPEPLYRDLLRHWSAQPKRAEEIRQIFADGNAIETCYERLWPQLAVISCWADAAAAAPARDLQRYFPHARIVPKGLLATEGIVSFPLTGYRGTALALRSHFFEFMPEVGDRTVRTAWQLRGGEQYVVILTTGGGLYRYQLADVVEVVGFAEQCPLIKFIGRGSKVSDLYGEKLHEAHVATALQQVFLQCQIAPAFALLAPADGDSPDRYLLFLAGEDEPCTARLQHVGRLLDEALCENIHYDYCRQLGQLGEIRVIWCGPSPHVVTRYQEAYLERGQRLGDIKPAVLSHEPGWAAYLFEEKPFKPN